MENNKGEVITMRYQVQKEQMEVPCEHPLCEQLHERFFNCQDFKGNWFHMLYRQEWIVVDTKTGMQEYLGLSKKDCIRVANAANAKENKITLERA